MTILISPNIVLSPVGDGLNGTPLTHARIGYQTFITEDMVTGSASIENFDVENIALDQTAETYKPSGSNAQIVIDAGTGVDVNYFGLTGRNMGGIKLEYSFNNSSWTTISEKNDGLDVVTMGLFETVLARYWRFTFFGSGQEVISIYLGKTLDMYRPIYGGHSPFNLSRTTSVRPSMSETGQWLGRTIQRKGFRGAFDFQHLPARWYRDNFDLFVQSARTKPFYIAWRPETFPNEVAYCWTSNDIQPVNMGTRDLMSVSFSAEGYDAEG
jgi:hypothetical protein